MNNNDTDLTAKFVIIGDIGVGKSSLMLRFTDNRFFSTPVITMDNDTRQRTLEVDNTKVAVKVWDTVGQERYKSITSRFFRHVNGVLLVFDVTNKRSFFGITNWLNDLDYHTISRSKCILVGNKIDLIKERVVTKLQGNALADRHGLLYSETSAKNDTNVLQTFTVLTSHILQQMKVYENNTKDTIKVDSSNGKKKRCCILL